jgi:hypothetical protein
MHRQLVGHLPPSSPFAIGRGAMPTTELHSNERRHHGLERLGRYCLLSGAERASDNGHKRGK